MLLTTTDELLDVFRDDVDDPLEGIDASRPDSDSLWPNRTIYRYMTEACDRLARDTNALFKVLTVPFVVDQEIVPLPASVLHIYNARLQSNGHELRHRNVDDTYGYSINDYGIRGIGMDALYSTRGQPRMYVRDADRKGMRIAPRPQRADSVIVQCSVTIATPMLEGMLLPFTASPDQSLLLIYMKHLAYQKRDADTLNLSEANAYGAQYAAQVVDREQEIRNQRRQVGLVRPEL